MAPSWSDLPPKEQAGSPDTPPERLLQLADTYFRTVLANPALPLVLLSDPCLGMAIRNTAMRRALVDDIHERVRRLDREQLAQLVAEHEDQARGSRPALKKDDPAPHLVARAVVEATRAAALREAEASFQLPVGNSSVIETNRRRYVEVELAMLEAVVRRLESSPPGPLSPAQGRGEGGERPDAPPKLSPSPRPCAGEKGPGDEGSQP